VVGVGFGLGGGGGGGGVHAEIRVSAMDYAFGCEYSNLFWAANIEYLCKWSSSEI